MEKAKWRRDEQIKPITEALVMRSIASSHASEFEGYNCNRLLLHSALPSPGVASTIGPPIENRLISESPPKTSLARSIIFVREPEALLKGPQRGIAVVDELIKIVGRVV